MRDYLGAYGSGGGSTISVNREISKGELKSRWFVYVEREKGGHTSKFDPASVSF